MNNFDSNDSVDRDVKNLLEDLIDHIQTINLLCDNVSVKLEPRHHKKFKKIKPKTTKKKRRIFSSSEDDSSSSSDSYLSENNNTLIDEDSNSDGDEQKILRDRHGPRTRNELVIDDLPPIENLTITLSDETPIEHIGYVRHIIDGKLIIIESLLHSPPLNDDSVLFNRDRRSIGLIFETFGPVEKPYYSIRFNDLNSIKYRQIEINQNVYYAPKETTYTKYVFVQELRALKGSDASWEDDNEPPKFAIDYSDDEQERAAKSSLKAKRNNNSEQMFNVQNNDFSNQKTNNSRGRNRGFHHSNVNRPTPNLPNWFQNPSNSASFQSGEQSFWPNNNTNVSSSVSNNSTLQSRETSLRGNNSTHSVFPWM